jgi:chromosome partitioning protein
LIDNDPQASLTQGFFGPEAMRAGGFGESVAALYDPEFAAMPETVIKPTAVQGVSLIPGSVRLTRFNQLPPEQWAESEFGIRDFLAEIRDDFDLILVDNPPNLHLCGWAALAASDGLVIPLQAEDYGAQGIVAVMEAVSAVRGRVNPSLATLGFLLTMYDKRLGIHLAYERHLREVYGDGVFTSNFPLAKDFKEAVAARLPASLYKPRSAAAKAVVAVAAELITRVEAMNADQAERSAA